MGVETESVHVTPAGGNIFADLGFDAEEADALLARSKQIISERMATMLKEGNDGQKSDRGDNDI